jgi:hypothetical protein
MMYQKLDEIDYKYIAAKIGDWATTRYGWFIKGDLRKDNVIETFADELKHLPSGCMRYIEEAQHKWIDDGHKKPPTMPDFLQMLRGFHNNYINNIPKMQIEDKKSENIFGLTATQWNGCRSDKDKEDWLQKYYHPDQASDATKYWIRTWMKAVGWESEKIKRTLGNSW